MNQHTHANKEIHGQIPSDFLIRFRKNLIRELVSVLQYFSFFIRVVMVTFFGVLTFLGEFSILKTILQIVLPPVMIFVFGKYLTVLPMYLVIFLSSVPVVIFALYNTVLSKITLVIIGFISISVVYSLFAIFLV